MTKKEIDRINAVPSKRLFLSIIADYDLNRSICELIDNALDIWSRGESNIPLTISLELEKNQQIINVTDNAGGVDKSELIFIVGPGQTGNLPTEEIIGIFGVGTKRAVVALAQDVTIITRYKNNKTYQVEFDETWLEDEGWELPVYEVNDIPENTTTIKLKQLRVSIDDEVISNLKEHLSAVYAYFLRNQGIIISVNSDRLQPTTFDDWAYPPNFPPHRYTGTIISQDGGTVNIEILAGLKTESSPASGEYGVYFYCNNRLVVRGLKNYDVGFTKGLAGYPHPSISLTRVIVTLKGQAQLMPWNSSKSGINPNHKVFIAFRNFLLQVVKDWTSLSRRLEGDWYKEVFQYKTGSIKEIIINNFPEAKKSYLPPLPKSKVRYSDLIIQINKPVAKNKPWTRGLYESMAAIDIISKQKLTEKNRICLILLDSTLEIGFKEYLVNETGKNYTDEKLFSIFNNRSNVVKEIKGYVNFPDELWQKIDYYYKIRCKLIHERASLSIADEQIEDFKETVNRVLGDLYNLKL